jgi:NAD+ synthase
VRIGVPICEDAWFEDVTETLAETGAEILLVPNGSPYHRGKMDVRQAQMVARVIETGLPLVYLNLLGGQDDQVFDGASFVLNPHGVLTHQMPAFEEGLFEVVFEKGADGWQALPGEKAHCPTPGRRITAPWSCRWATTCARRVFQGAARPLGRGGQRACGHHRLRRAGPENVRCVMLPSRFTSDTSLEDARDTAARLGCRLDTVSIGTSHEAVLGALGELFEGTEPGVTRKTSSPACAA